MFSLCRELKSSFNARLWGWRYRSATSLESEEGAKGREEETGKGIGREKMRTEKGKSGGLPFFRT